MTVHEGYRRQLIESEEALVRQKARQLDSEVHEPDVKAVTSLLGAVPIFALAQADAPALQNTGEQNTGEQNTGEQNTGEQNTTAASPAGDDAAQSVVAQPDVAPPVTESEGTVLSEDELNRDLPASGFAPADIQRWGFVYLLGIESLLLLRLMLDPLMVRRPLLDPNLTTGGLNFIGISLFIFMMANVVYSTPRIQVTQGPALGPGYAMMNMLPAIPTRPVSNTPGGVLPPTNAELTASQARLAMIAKMLAIFAHLAIVAGIVLISNRHFANLRAGVGCATLYLMLPYTAQMTGRVDHALPAALLLWAVLSYRKPFVAGIFLGLAGGLVYYPLFLLPLWFSFYWQRGARPFAVGVVAMLALLMLALSFDDSASLTEHLRRMFGLLNPNREAHELRGIWGLGWNPIWRLPVIVAFVILSIFFAIWPAQKNLGTLLSGSAALMVAAQFWHGYGAGLYIAWFLPLLLLTVFRPNLQDRVATKVVRAGSRAMRGSRSELEPV